MFWGMCLPVISAAGLKPHGWVIKNPVKTGCAVKTPGFHPFFGAASV
jgi:hypothetical protein